MYSSVAFSTFTVLCTHPLCLVPEYFPSPKGNPVPWPLVTTHPLSVSMNLFVLGFPCKRNPVICGLLCQASFTECPVCRAHPRCATDQNLLLFYGWVLFHPMNSCATYGVHSSFDGLFWQLWLCCCECVWLSVWTVSLGCSPSCGIAESHGDVTCRGSSKPRLERAHHLPFPLAVDRTFVPTGE